METIKSKKVKVKPFTYLEYRNYFTYFYQVKDEIVKAVIDFPNYRWEANFINLHTAKIVAKEQIGNYIYCTKQI